MCIEQTEPNFLQVLKVLEYNINRYAQHDLRTGFQRKAKDTRRDGREGNRT